MKYKSAGRKGHSIDYSDCAGCDGGGTVVLQ